MANDRMNGRLDGANSYRLTIFRVSAGKQFILRMLSVKVNGLFTHYKNRRSHYCAGKVCDCQYHNVPRVWKGYVAAEVYEQSENLWYPQILEVTEYLELDFRGVYGRGQVWKVERRAEKKGQTNPVTGKLLETRDQATFPPAHNILDTLRHVYHDSELQLGCDNPLPARTYVTCSQGDPPAGYAPTKAQTPQDVLNIRSMIGELKAKFEMPSENGKQ